MKEKIHSKKVSSKESLKKMQLIYQIFIGRTDVEVETPILWPPDVKNRFIGKDSDARKD